MLDHRRDNHVVRRFKREAERFEFHLTPSQDLERPRSRFCDQFAENLLSERLAKIVYLVVVYAVFTKQRCQIAARRSGRLFVNDYFLAHRL
jgi:hypothetical protein